MLDQAQKKLLRKFIAVNLRIDPKVYEEITTKLSATDDAKVIEEVTKWVAAYKAQLQTAVTKAQAEIGEL